MSPNKKNGLTAVSCFLAALLAGGAAEGAKIGLDPLMGDGAGGRTTSIYGVNFEPSTSFTVLVGGLAVTPATVASDAAGTIPSTSVALPPLPGGNLDVTLTGAFTRTFTGAFRVWPNICLSPAQGNGMSGSTYVTDTTLPGGGWRGMVFIVSGTGFKANATIGANTITVGSKGTKHSVIPVGADGILPSTTVMVSGNLANGAKDIVINDGTANTFSGAYTVNRCIGLNPACGTRVAGSPITITGWGFADGTIAQDSILVAGGATTHPAAGITGGSFSVNLTVNAGLGNGVANDVTINDGTAATVFPGAFFSVRAGTEYYAISPVRLTGIANEVIEVTGISGVPASIPANTMGISENNKARSGTTHAAITVTAGAFPPTWVKINGNLPWGSNRLETGSVAVEALAAGRYLAICPLVSNGYAGWSVTLNGFGFEQGNTPGLNTITIGGSPTTHAAVTIPNTGDFLVPVTVSQPLPFGPQNVVTDDAYWADVPTFAGAVRVRRTIGLSSFVVGPGAAGETVQISGSGFTASSTISGITFNGSVKTHPAITVGPNGSFGPTTITLDSVMNSGTYDINAQEVFPAPYRVYDPLSAVSKFSDPGRGAPSQIVTFSFSFTNAQYVGDPSARAFVLSDNLPAQLQYVGASSNCSLPALTEWYAGGWSAVEPVPASSATAIRWTLTNPLPAGASGWANFQMVVP